MLGGIEKACDSALAALAAGDGKALEVLYDRMGRAILSVAYAVTGNLHDAEDVLSDTLVDAAVGAKGYRCGTGACAWLLTAARHNALDVVRRRSVRLRREAAEEEGAARGAGLRCGGGARPAADARARRTRNGGPPRLRASALS